jgi:peptidyl-prolyl cis-trans isomerase SurA
MKDLRCFDLSSVKKAGAFILVALLMVLAGNSASRANFSDRIVAIVNGELILESDLKRHKLPVVRNIMSLPLGIVPPGKWPTEKELLDELIVIHLLEQEAKRKGVKVEDKNLDASVQSIRERKNLSPRQFTMVLAAQGLTLAEYKAILKTQYTLTRLIGTEVLQKVPFSEEDAVEYFKKKGKDTINEEYDKLKQSMTGAPPAEEPKVPEIPTHWDVYVGGQFRLRQITLSMKDPKSVESVKKKAMDIIEQANTGADFAQLAKKYSQDQSASSGGDMGRMNYKDAMQGLQDIVKHMKLHQVRGIPQRDAIRIFYLEEEKNRTAKKELIPEPLRKQLEKQRQAELDRVAEEMKKRAEMEKQAEESEADQEKPKIPKGALTPAEEKDYLKVRRKAIDLVRHEKLQVRMKEWIGDIKKTSSIEVKI